MRPLFLAPDDLIMSQSFSLYLHSCVLFLFPKETRPIGIGSHIIGLIFYFITYLRTLSPNMVKFCYTTVETSMFEFLLLSRCSVMSDSFATPCAVVHQAPLPMEFSRQEYWSGLPFHFPGDFPDPGIKPASPVSPALPGGFSTTEAPGKPYEFWGNTVKPITSCL